LIIENGKFKTNIIKDKTFEFSLKVIYVLSKQLLRSGISIGANVVEATDAISKKDFRNKMSIAFKEMRIVKNAN